MTNAIHPFHLLATALAAWLNRHQQAVIDYLIEENRILKQQLKEQRLRFTDEQRRRLALKAKILGRQLLDEIGNARHSGYPACLAPKAHRGEVDLSQKRAGATPCHARDHRFGTTHSEGKRHLGL